MSDRTPPPPSLHVDCGRVVVLTPERPDAAVDVPVVEACRMLLAFPDLLAACEAVLSAPVVAAPHPCWQMVRDAVARAKGATP